MDVLFWEVVGHPDYFCLNEADSVPDGINFSLPGYYTFSAGDNYFFEMPVQSFQFPDYKLALLPMQNVKRL